MLTPVLLAVVFVVPMINSCGEIETAEEKANKDNLKSAIRLPLVGKTLNVENKLFTLSCNQFFFRFLMTRSNPNCVAVTVNTEIANDALNWTISSADGSTTVTGKEVNNKITIDGTEYSCYVQSGTVYKENGERVIGASQVLLSKSTAPNPSLVRAADIDYVGIFDDSVCDAVY